MSLEAYVVTGAAFILLMVGLLASHHRKAKRVDGTLFATFLAFAIGIYFMVAIGVQTGKIKQLQANLRETTAAVAPGFAGGLELAVPVPGEEGGIAVEYKRIPLLGLIAVVIGVIAMGLGVGASRRGDRAGGQTLMVLGIFVIVIAVVVFAVMR